MTPAEWIEHVEENLGFPESGVGQDPNQLLYCTKEQCELLRVAHERYVSEIEKILFPDGR